MLGASLDFVYSATLTLLPPSASSSTLFIKRQLSDPPQTHGHQLHPILRLDHLRPLGFRRQDLPRPQPALRGVWAHLHTAMGRDHRQARPPTRPHLLVSPRRFGSPHSSRPLPGVPQ